MIICKQIHVYENYENEKKSLESFRNRRSSYLVIIFIIFFYRITK
jgi:hypothetical protein